MKKKIFALFIVVVLSGCSATDVQNIIQIATSKDPTSTLSKIATQKATSYSSKEIANIINKFLKAIEKEWGKESKTPSPKEYVKYTQNYKSMTYVNFDTGEILVQTVDEQNPKESLKNAIITTLLTPEDPRSIDMYSDASIKLSGTPYLYKSVQDHTGNYINSKSRASSFADFLIKNTLQTKTTKLNNETQNIYYITIKMVSNHTQVRAKKYLPLVEKYSKKYGISKSLIFAIMQTESDFNPFAISSANAIGLMQVVPNSAGKDVNNFLYGKNTAPTRDFLYDANNNIHFGTTYLHMLQNKYLSNINNPISKEYCIIAGYNTGAGNVLKTFSSNKTKAFDEINRLDANTLYKKLKKDLPYDETRRYLDKVLHNKKNFVNM
ncbi:MAG: membrane-bound lytic murein transglycosylase MltC [Arcobacteraceae bacterium]|jgi:membrane-bound lytic murein transglycosylase C|nr:membrane-bound lytic murein transglycosylase MltC [Arcobacteraceae bacterium]MDY0365773.1 membrane-bound lytic murein transglycosylase MltC [Arcobacteraceae bacterium]